MIVCSNWQCDTLNVYFAIIFLIMEVSFTVFERLVESVFQCVHTGGIDDVGRLMSPTVRKMKIPSDGCDPAF